MKVASGLGRVKTPWRKRTVSYGSRRNLLCRRTRLCGGYAFIAAMSEKTPTMLMTRVML
jgi:hypothetical protein